MNVQLDRLQAMAIMWMSEQPLTLDYWQQFTDGDSDRFLELISPAVTQGDLDFLFHRQSPITDLFGVLQAAALLHCSGTAEETRKNTAAAREALHAHTKVALVSPVVLNHIATSVQTMAGLVEAADWAEWKLEQNGWRFDARDRKVKRRGSKRELLVECVERVYEEARPHYIRMAGDPTDNPQTLRDVIALNLRWFFPLVQLDVSEGGTIQTAIRNFIARERASGWRFNPETGFKERIRSK